ncbi:MAG: hypothetical protein WEB30_09205 [Cyclobacteriaceae bacterium]
MIKAFIFFCWFSFLLCFEINSQQGDELPFTKGVYGDAGAFLKNGMPLRSLGINAIFVHSASLKDELYKAAKAEGVRVYAEFPTLNGKEYLEEHPEAWPINEKGERAPIADWFMGICPTDPGFRKYREQQLHDLLSRYQVDGIWLDYLHWHAQFETPNPILPETCFCERCLLQFQEEMKVDIPSGDIETRSQWILTRSDSSWRLWRSSVLNDWVSDMKTILKTSQPSALLGIYYCPWFPEDYGGANYRTLGLDMKALAEIADVFSPMLYHRMMGRSPAWVGEYVKWLHKSVIGDGKALIWPIVQAHNKPGVITTEEFREVMWNGSRAPSTGIMMFTLHTLIGDAGKLEVMKDLYRKR